MPTTERPEVRRRIMQAVKSQNTGLEMIVRRLTHGMGYRYRLHRKDLPGRPDLAFPRRRKVIFVHGCFWHQHDCPKGNRLPRTNQDYWIPKLRRNKLRDEEQKKRLCQMGWSVLVIWECETKNLDALSQRIRTFLDA